MPERPRTRSVESPDRKAGNTKVRKPEGWPRKDDEVLRLDVAVDDAVLMEQGQRLERLRNEEGKVPGRDASRQALREAFGPERIGHQRRR